MQQQNTRLNDTIGVELSLFFLCTLGFSVSYITLLAVSGAGNDSFSILVVFSPTIIAGILTVSFHGWKGFKQLFIDRSWRPIPKHILLFGLIWAVVPAIIAIVFQLFRSGPVKLFSQTAFFPQIIFILLISLGEEFGWRGYALPHLQKRYSPIVSSLILGLLWGAWHYPGYLIGVGTPLEVPFIMFMVWVVAATFIMTWGFNRSNQNPWMGFLMHSTANATFSFFLLLPEMTGDPQTFYLFVGCVVVFALSMTLMNPQLSYSQDTSNDSIFR